MNKFELFSLIYYALEKYSKDNPLEERENFLSGMSPFTFDDIGSADPEIYEDFCIFVRQDKFDISDSFLVAKQYVESIKMPIINEAFSWVSDEKWEEAARKYLSKNHKGKD
ncbi:MAG: hypothetical protein Q4E54_08265 [Lachnospiraceae bacterium]|nr:hypothetical protein [Lachnospiraceae bacterium]